MIAVVLIGLEIFLGSHVIGSLSVTNSGDLDVLNKLITRLAAEFIADFTEFKIVIVTTKINY